MSDRDDATGQFTNDPPLFGLAGVERDAGFIPLPEPETNDPDELSIEQAAEAMGFGTTEGEVRSYVEGDSYDDPTENPKETVTLERAGKEAAAADERDELAQDEADAQAIRDEVDKLRGVDPEAKAAKPEAKPVADGELEPDLEKALNDPRIKDAIAAQISETETTRQHHVNGLAAATQIAEASFFSRYPEFANVAPEQRGTVFASILQNDPGRAASIQADVSNLANLVGRYGAEQQQLSASAKAKFQEYARAQNARFEEQIKDVPRAQRNEVENEIATAIGERGNLNEVMTFLRTSEASSAEVMGLLWDLGETRLQLKAIKNAPKSIATKNLPPVQRPGIAAARTSGIEADINALDRRLSATGSLKDARALLEARSRRARG